MSEYKAVPNIIRPIATAINVANITAPAEMSFAIPTKREYLLWNIASSVNSIAEFNISATTTRPIAKSNIQSFAMLKSKTNPKIITNNATKK